MGGKGRTGSLALEEEPRMARRWRRSAERRHTVFNLGVRLHVSQGLVDLLARQSAEKHTVDLRGTGYQLATE